jgi:DUF1365 family protein
VKSAIFVGRVTHRRKMPFRHELAYRVFSLLVDLDEVDELDARSRLFSHNRWNLLSLHDRDHGARDGSSMRLWVFRQLHRAGIDLSAGHIEVLLFPRVLGYQFNPLTVWFCYGGDGSLRAVLYEIHNTFGQSHSHLIPVEGCEPLRHSFGKELHVSPFFDRDGAYTITLRPPGERYSISIDYATVDEERLTATMVGSRREFTDRELLRAFLTHPLLTLKVISGIHWHALRILLKGGRYHPVPDAPVTPVRIESLSRR